MKKINNIYIGLAALALTACNSEAPFDGAGKEGSGRILTNAIELEVRAEDMVTRSVAVPVPADFTVEIYHASEDDKTKPAGEPVESYPYTDMPEVITLNVGDYVATAYYGGEYGEGKNAAFDAPYYLGTEAFTITEGKIVTDLATIICRPANVKVSVNFDEELQKSMSPDSKVTVKVGDGGSLDFTKDTDQDGYFEFVDGSTTLAATFTGKVDGVETTEIKTYEGVKPGLYYRVTFRLHSVDPNQPNYPDDPNDPPTNPDDPNVPTPPDGPDDPTPGVSGDIIPGDQHEEDTSGFLVDADITFRDLTNESGITVDPEGDEFIVDDMRPGICQGDVNNPGSGDDNPGQDNPGTDVPGQENPSNPGEGEDPGTEDPTPSQPEKHNPPKVEGINGTTDTNINPESFDIKITSESEKGFSGFIVDIDSNVLTPETLEGVNLSSHIDLINPGGLRDALEGLGFPVAENVLGKTDIDISITSLLELLEAVSSDGSNNNFIFTVTDEYGTTKKTISIIYR